MDPLLSSTWQSVLTPETLLGIAVGLGLAAAAGFRVFVPLLVASLAARTGMLTLGPEYGWLSSTLAIAALSTATLLEIGAYSVPWLDQLLDVVATPAALLAGMLATAAVVVDVPPALSWALVLMGAGAAGLTQGATVLTRLKSTTVTSGVANPFVSMAELVGAVITSLLAIFLPVVALVMLAFLLVVMTRRLGRVAFGRRAASRSAAEQAVRPPRVPRGGAKS